MAQGCRLSSVPLPSAFVLILYPPALFSNNYARPSADAEKPTRYYTVTAPCCRTPIIQLYLPQSSLYTHFFSFHCMLYANAKLYPHPSFSHIPLADPEILKSMAVIIIRSHTFRVLWTKIVANSQPTNSANLLLFFNRLVNSQDHKIIVKKYSQL